MIRRKLFQETFYQAARRLRAMYLKRCRECGTLEVPSKKAKLEWMQSQITESEKIDEIVRTR